MLYTLCRLYALLMLFIIYVYAACPFYTVYFIYIYIYIYVYIYAYI